MSEHRWHYTRRDSGYLQERSLEDFLCDGWEPFAVTNGSGRGTGEVVHLRRHSTVDPAQPTATEASTSVEGDGEVRHCDGCGEDYDAFEESHVGHEPSPTGDGDHDE